MRSRSILALFACLALIAGCGKGVDIKRDVVFDQNKPVVVWFEPLASGQSVRANFISTGFVVDFYLVEAASEAKAREMIDQQWPKEGYTKGWTFKPGNAVVLGKVLDKENDGLNANIPAGKAFAAILYPVSKMPEEYHGTYKGHVWIAKE